MHLISEKGEKRGTDLLEERKLWPMDGRKKGTGGEREQDGFFLERDMIFKGREGK